MRTVSILLTTLILFGCSGFLDQKIEDKTFKGKWYAMGKAYVATVGDFEIMDNYITFDRFGDVGFTVLSNANDSYLLELEKPIADNVFIEIGPVKSPGYAGYAQMEVSYYSTKEDAMAEKIIREKNISAWGIYTRQDHG